MGEIFKSDLQNRSSLFYGESSRNKPLPFFREFLIQPINADMPPDPLAMSELCVSKILTGAIIGYIAGGGMGLIMGAMGDTAPQILHGREIPQAPIREHFRQMYKISGSRMSGWAKQFCMLSALFGGVECVIEKYRAKHDLWNPVASGCVVGATMSAKAGLTASCVGCIGFGGFSLVVDAIMGEH